MKFKHIFIAVFVGTALVVVAFLLNRQRPAHETQQPSADFVKATGKCAECHSNETSAVVHQFERSAHTKQGVTCLDCHQPLEGQKETNHRGFTVTEDVTSKNCASCHADEYEQFERSRHAAPAWAAVKGREPFTDAQIAHADQYHEGAVDGSADKLAQLEDAETIERECGACHSIGKPNADGSIGSCTECHSTHNTSVRQARLPRTCGQCHTGPEHGKIETYQASRHGLLFENQRDDMNLDAAPARLTTRDMPVPTCSTCHMSGIENLDVTHDVSERLSRYLFAPVSEKRPKFEQARGEMKRVCGTCHSEDHVETYYDEAEAVLRSTNDKLREMQVRMEGLREDGLLTDEPFDETIEFVYFDLWHHVGPAAKHSAFTGDAGVGRWHGTDEWLEHMVEFEEMAEELRHNRGESEDGGADD